MFPALCLWVSSGLVCLQMAEAEVRAARAAAQEKADRAAYELQDGLCEERRSIVLAESSAAAAVNGEELSAMRPFL
jgi:hypothetical protein